MYGAAGVTFRFGATVALTDVTVDVVPGEVTAVVGGDGSGKSTLLRTVVGRVAPQQGEVTAPPRQRLGYQPAVGGTWPDLTVAENMQFVAKTYGLTASDVASRSAELLQRAGLDGDGAVLARDLSGGMRTKLGYCLAMVHRPDLLVLDEPSTGVDPVSRVELWKLLSEAATAGTAVLLSTTYLDEAERASRVVLLERGRVLLRGRPDEIVASSSGVVVRTRRVVRPEFSWRYADGFREWWPQTPPDGSAPVTIGLEDVAIVASLRAAAADPEEPLEGSGAAEPGAADPGGTGEPSRG